MALLHDEKTEMPVNLISTNELAREVWRLGFISYGGPMAHIGLFKEIFINNLRW